MVVHDEGVAICGHRRAGDGDDDGDGRVTLLDGFSVAVELEEALRVEGRIADLELRHRDLAVELAVAVEGDLEGEVLDGGVVVGADGF